MSTTLTTRPGPSSRLLASAAAAGLVGAREVAAGLVDVHTAAPQSGSVLRGSRPRRSVLCVRGRPVAYAREADRTDAGAGFERERRSLAALAGLPMVPALVAADDGVLWVRAAPGEDLGTLRGTVTELAELAQRWGSGLAALHRAPTPPAGLVARRSWLLEPSAAPTPATPAQAGVLRVLRTDPDLRQMAMMTAERWAVAGWIHGDQRVGHVLGAWVPEAEVHLVDFTAAGVGDPGWDVAGALEAARLLGHRCSVAPEIVEEYLLRGYRRAAGPGRVDPGMRALGAVGTAWSLAGDPAERPERVTGWLERARGLAARAGHRGTAAA